MKNIRLSISAISTAALLFAATPARALTVEDIAGIYQGTSVATLPSGQTVTASVTIRLKNNGHEKVTAIVNGQTSVSKAVFAFASDDIIVGGNSASEFTAFITQNGTSLTLMVLAKELATGEFVLEITTLALVTKL